jgi:hypothetical protein
MLTDTDIEKAEQQEVKPVGNQPTQQQVDAAFITSQRHPSKFFILQPYTPSREVAGQAMRLHYGYFDEDDSLQFDRTKLYAGALRDVAIVMWLCAKATDDEIDSAGVEPKAAARKAIDWAKANNLLDIQSDQFVESYMTFFDIMNEIWISRSTPQKKIPTSAKTN